MFINCILKLGDTMTKKNFLIIIFSFLAVVLVLLTLFNSSFNNSSEKEEVNKLTAKVIDFSNNIYTIKNDKDILYTIESSDDIWLGDVIDIEYRKIVSDKINDYKIINIEKNENNVLTDDGIFKKYYNLAQKKLETMSIDEKISQILLVRCPDTDEINVLKNYQFGGYVFYAKDFEGKMADDVKKLMSNLQDVSKIPILTAVDEEGGRVIRISSNPNLSDNPFKSPREIYLEGGFEGIREDTIKKSKLLYELGLNLNLAPVVDVSVNSNDYMYSRSIGENTTVTSKYAKEVIRAGKGLGVSYTLKHFPGYGNNRDTHRNKVVDTRTYDYILKNDLPPFKAGIDEGAEATLVSHNIVSSIDLKNPASLSIDIHNLLRSELGFTGIIITDDLAMGATKDIEDSAVKAILALNDLIITTDYNQSINDIKKALANKVIDESMIDKMVFRILAWKYYKKLIDY